MLRNVLSPKVPLLAAQAAKEVFEGAQSRLQFEPSQITTWILHPGGRDVLLALQKELRLANEDLRWSAAILAEYGNLSSASLFFILETALQNSAPRGYWWASSFGAGFSCHGALLDVQ